MNSPQASFTMEQVLAQAGWLRRVAGALLGQDDAADDAVQETWMATLGRPPLHQRNLRAWLRAVMLNRIRGAGRRRKAEQRALVRLHDDEGAEGDQAARTPEDLVASLQLQRQVAALLLDLDAPHREVLFLRYIEELDSSQIGRRLGIPPGTVRFRLKTGLADLRRRLDETDRSDGPGWRRALAPLLAPERPAAAGPGAIGVKAALPSKALPLAIAALAGGAALVLVAGTRPQRSGVLGRADAAPGRSATTEAVSATKPAGMGSRPPQLRSIAGASHGDDPPSAAPRADVGLAGPRTAPFSGLRWRDDRPAVQVDTDWAELLAIDGTPIAEVIGFCKQRYPHPPELWRKRISEDLVDVLTAMGHPPGLQVRLEIQRAQGGRESVDASMTTENRARVLQENRRANLVDGLDRGAAGETAAPTPALLDRFARVAPFTGVHFRGEQIDVEVDGAWYHLRALGGVATERLVEVAKRQFASQWQKRIAEDPAEVLTAATRGSPGTTVELQLEEPGSGRQVHRPDAPMTEANRRAAHRNWRVEAE